MTIKAQILSSLSPNVLVEDPIGGAYQSKIAEKWRNRECVSL